jgi:hypothetical protein
MYRITLNILVILVRIPQRHGRSSFVFLVCCAGSGLCDELNTRSEESYRLCVCLTECDLETSTRRQPRPSYSVEPQKRKV